MKKQALIVYGTRYGASESTSEEIAKTLRGEGLEVRIVNAKKEQIKDISGYDLVIIGSGMQFDKWTNEPENFLIQFQQELANKKTAIFVSSAIQSLLEKEKKTEENEKIKVKYLQDKVAKYNLHPISTAIFGGVLDYNKMLFLFRAALGSFKPRFKAAGYQEVKPGLYDTRNWDAIRSWAREVAAAA